MGETPGQFPVMPAGYFLIGHHLLLFYKKILNGSIENFIILFDNPLLFKLYRRKNHLTRNLLEKLKKHDCPDYLGNISGGRG
jgi:hypothetical protein